MEILVVVGTLSGQGGIETCVQSLAQEARANGDHVRVLALCPSTVDGSWHEGLDYGEMPNGSPSLRRQAIESLPAVVRACRQQRPDAVIVIYSSSIPLARLALFLAGLKRPVMAWLHFSDALKQRTSLLRFAHGHICISQPIVESTRRLAGIRPENVHLVHNGTRVDSTAPIARSAQGPLRIVHVGRLTVGGQKRTDDLLRALATVEGDWRLQVVGTVALAGDAGKLEALADALGIADRIDWVGWQPDPWAALERADLLVLCSAFEGFPMVLIEAMARGIPCLSSDCPSGPSDIVRPGQNGWLYPVADYDALAGRLQAIVANRSLLPAPDAVRASVRPFSSRAVFLKIRKAIEQTRGSACPPSSVPIHE
ncbi:UDP-D-galactose:(glucosyl)LPS alpha-1,6-D-galactosyltransferase [Variovorax sp. HW608]|uniref:glycosyltransferase n=1 Tax=Variovorax sp. HW608 TaxID=1034889 RepID=UPI00081FA5EA|nr:glycosyltransferase [Variovorax sp. HW608]SCK51909.1 UDP-D-galactose:(glucosyl)LPS alpha-1,6-D-galactosyltransferase [Variovorax sp. HW608]